MVYNRHTDGVCPLSNVHQRMEHLVLDVCTKSGDNFQLTARIVLQENVVNLEN